MKVVGKMVKIEIIEGDITQVAADVLVNAANNHLWMGAGVAGALKKTGGREIEEEAMRKGPVAVGEVVVTSPGRLPAKYIIHAAVMGQDLRTNAVIVGQATINALREADQLGVRSIALPALGTGVGGFPMAECARIMISAARAYSPQNHLEKVFFVLYGRAAYRVFSRELAEQSHN
jgi:O-acetyl-ADP-ribose deacetylase (regulator of RNase III)